MKKHFNWKAVGERLVMVLIPLVAIVWTSLAIYVFVDMRSKPVCMLPELLCKKTPPPTQLLGESFELWSVVLETLRVVL